MSEVENRRAGSAEPELKNGDSTVILESVQNLDERHEFVPVLKAGMRLGRARTDQKTEGDA